MCHHEDFLSHVIETNCKNLEDLCRSNVLYLYVLDEFHKMKTTHWFCDWYLQYSMMKYFTRGQTPFTSTFKYWILKFSNSEKISTFTLKICILAELKRIFPQLTETISLSISSNVKNCCKWLICKNHSPGILNELQVL